MCAARLTLVLLSLLLLVTPVFAARNLVIEGNKTSLLGDEEVMLTASASGFTSGETVFIKGAFYKDGSSNYFGYTKNGDSWVKNSTKTNNQRQVVIGSWDGTILVKNDYTDSGFSGTGQYLLKVGFYTLAKDGNPNSVDWSDNSLSIHLEALPPTSVPTSTTKPSHTPKPTATKLPDTSSIPYTPTMTNVLALEDTEGDLLPEAASTSSAEALAQEALLTGTPAPTVTPSFSAKSNPALPFIYIGLVTGVLSLVSLGVIVWRKLRAGEGDE